MSLRLCFLTLLLTSMIPAVSLGQEPTLHPGYPGRDGRATEDIGIIQVQTALKTFYRVYHRWPENWGEVVQEGLWQRPIIGPNLQVIDPDDPELGHWMDLHYSKSDRSVTSLVIPTRMERIELGEVSHLFSDWLPIVERHFPEFDSTYWLEDIDRVKLLAIVGLLKQGLMRYNAKWGRNPKDLRELLESGFSPIDELSLNPATAKRFRFDGSANDIFVSRNKSGEISDFLPVKADGRRLEVTSTW